jgi:hypothetical protein
VGAAAVLFNPRHQNRPHYEEQCDREALRLSLRALRYQARPRYPRPRAPGKYLYRHPSALQRGRSPEVLWPGGVLGSKAERETGSGRCHRLFSGAVRKGSTRRPTQLAAREAGNSRVLRSAITVRFYTVEVTVSHVREYPRSVHRNALSHSWMPG